MQGITKRNGSSNEYIRDYSNMRGLSLVKSFDDPCHFSYLENMYVDYESGGGAIESIPGFRRLYSFEQPINSICSCGDNLLIHAADELYLINKEERDNIPTLSPIANLKNDKSHAFRYNGSTFISDGEQILFVDGSGSVGRVDFTDVKVDFTAGAVHEEVLMLSGAKGSPSEVFCLKANDDCTDFSIERCFKMSDPVVSMSSLFGYLWIITPNSILGYKKRDGQLVEEIKLDGITPLSPGVVFNGELAFVTRSGIYTLSYDDKIKLACRSSAINPMLLNENLRSARLALWRGYLAVCVGGRIYLADSRDMSKVGDSMEYRWYYLNGIGTYRKDKRVYRYAPANADGYCSHLRLYEKAEGEIMSVTNKSGDKIFFVEADGKKYSVHPTDEFDGGLFFPAVCVYQTDDLLFFGTECGDLCVFNNDMRGVAPKRLSQKADFNEDEYKSTFGTRIHPDFYSFDRHAPRYAVLTPRDRCGFPFDKKTDLPSSLILTLKSFPKSSLIIEEKHDSGSFRQVKKLFNSTFDFYNLDFENASTSPEDYSTVTLSHRCIGWKDKQISIYSKEFCSPFGIYSICFGFKIQKTKKHLKKGRK